MKNILLITAAERPDLYNYLEADKENKYCLLCGIKTESKSFDLIPPFIQSVYYWENFISPFDLLKTIKPDVLVFFEIFDLYQTALIVLANSLRLPTFFLDHGLRVDQSGIDKYIAEAKTQNKSSKLTKLRNFETSVFKSYRFYYSAITKIDLIHLWQYIVYPFYSMLNSGEVAMHAFKFPEKQPSSFMIFCKNNFASIKYFYHCQSNDIHYSGVPFFDYMFSSSNKNEQYILFLDQPNYEAGILDWTPDFHRSLATSLEDFAKEQNIVIHIKLHPASDMNLWKSYELDQSKIVILQKEPMEDYYLNAKLILSYSSTLLIGLLSSQKNIVLLGWNPKPGVYGVDFSMLNVCHLSLKFSDLKASYAYWLNNNLCKINKESYNQFIEHFNYPFDGFAAKRICNLINGKS